MESARQELRRWERARIAWGVTAVACVTALPFTHLRQIVLIAAFVGWFMHLFDVKLAAVLAQDERRNVPFTSGWPLLASVTASSILRLDPTLWLALPLSVLLVWLLWRAWTDVRKA